MDASLVIMIYNMVPHILHSMQKYIRQQTINEIQLEFFHALI